MSFVHNMHIVGGIKESFALLSAEYPSGSHCTCSNGTKTLTATDTSGSYVFPIPEAGSWTVRCWDGASYESSDNKASQIVNITTQYQVENINLAYRIRLYIYDDGVYYFPMTNAQAASHSAFTLGSFTDNSDSFTIGAGRLQGICRRTADKIDISNYSTLNITAQFNGGNAFQRDGAIIYADPADNHHRANVSIDTTLQTYSVDITSLSGEEYVGVYVVGYESYSAIDVYSIWLE